LPVAVNGVRVRTRHLEILGCVLRKGNSVLVDEFQYDLPPELIAQRPLEERDASRMMLLDREKQTFEDRRFRDLPYILDAGDVLVFNNTKVFPARLLGRRRGARAQKIGKNNPARREYLSAEIELFLARPEGNDTWQALVRPGRKIRTGEVLVFGDEELEAEVLGRGEYGLRRVRLRAQEGTVDHAIDRLGHVPLPPYIHRQDEASDRNTYQTIYATTRGAIAAPTAGFHFSERVVRELRARGILTCEITLHVGLGTFRPIHTKHPEEHKMDAERFEVSESAASTVNRALDEGRQVIAVGSTSVRTLEHVALENGGKLVPCRGETSLFILPGYQFRVTRGLLTNFHLPKSTLLMLVAAFAGKDLVLKAYRHAVEQRYRFYSYGDCMLVL
jgi:S-adenosylmethionine:tRNA ribosyltransferase-isomerase